MGFSLVAWPEEGLAVLTGNAAMIWTMIDQASYICGACGEEIVIPVDLSAGSSQEYVEDCPVCCSANVIHLKVGDGDQIRAWAEQE